MDEPSLDEALHVMGDDDRRPPGEDPATSSPEDARVDSGEDPGTRSAEQARYWIGFYQELLEVETSVLAHMRELQAKASRELGEAIRQSNVEPLGHLMERFQGRLHFWRGRLAELERE